MVEPNNTKKVRCDFCKHISNGGITRAKEHQMGVKGDVTSCKQIPAHVKEQLREAERKKMAQVESYTIDDDEEQEVQQILELKSKGKRPASSSTQASKKTQASNRKGPLHQYFYEPPEVTINSKKRQTSINDACDKEV